MACSLCCLHSGSDIAQMGRSGMQPDRHRQTVSVRWRGCEIPEGESAMTELCVCVCLVSVCSGVTLIHYYHFSMCSERLVHGPVLGL